MITFTVSGFKTYTKYFVGVHTPMIFIWVSLNFQSCHYTLLAVYIAAVSSTSPYIVGVPAPMYTIYIFIYFYRHFRCSSFSVCLALYLNKQTIFGKHIVIEIVEVVKNWNVSVYCTHTHTHYIYTTLQVWVCVHPGHDVWQWWWWIEWFWCCRVACIAYHKLLICNQEIFSYKVKVWFYNIIINTTMFAVV